MTTIKPYICGTQYERNGIVINMHWQLADGRYYENMDLRDERGK